MFTEFTAFACFATISFATTSLRMLSRATGWYVSTGTIMFSFTRHTRSTGFNLFHFHCRTERYCGKECCLAAALILERNYNLNEDNNEDLRMEGFSMCNGYYWVFELYEHHKTWGGILLLFSSLWSFRNCQTPQRHRGYQFKQALRSSSFHDWERSWRSISASDVSKYVLHD